MDADLTDDPVGVASARMLGAGVSAGERRGALRLLGALESFTVPVPLGTVASEFDLDRRDCERWADHLARAGVLVHDGGGVALVAREADVDSGLRLNDFLDAVTELDERRHRRHVTVLRPLVGALAVAAAVLAFVAFPRPAARPEPTLTTGVDGAPVTATTTAVPGAGPAATPPATAASRRPTRAPGSSSPTATAPSGPAPAPSPCAPLTIPSLPTTTSVAPSLPAAATVPPACSGP